MGQLEQALVLHGLTEKITAPWLQVEHNVVAGRTGSFHPGSQRVGPVQSASTDRRHPALLDCFTRGLPRLGRHN
jgi:hypothetical protein